MPVCSKASHVEAPSLATPPTAWPSMVHVPPPQPLTCLLRFDMRVVLRAATGPTSSTYTVPARTIKQTMPYMTNRTSRTSSLTTAPTDRVITTHEPPSPRLSHFMGLNMRDIQPHASNLLLGDDVAVQSLTTQIESARSARWPKGLSVGRGPAAKVACLDLQRAILTADSQNCLEERTRHTRRRVR